jgi:nucleoside-diphosphate-sugar epimerase
VKRALVTGGSGFIGRHTLEPLVRLGYDVHAVARHVGLPLEGVVWHATDLLDAAALRGVVKTLEPTHLLHAAWSVTPGKYATSPDNLAWVRASLELFEAFAAAGGRHALVTGTCFEYDWTDGVCSERTPLAPNTLYGTAKASLQQLLQAYARQAGFTLAWARIFYLYGPHEHRSRLIASVIRSLLAGEPARCSHGNQRRDFLHVQDVADALVAVLDATVDGPINIGSGEAVRLKDLIYRAAGLIGRDDLVQLGVMPVPHDEPPLIVADVTRLREQTGWVPRFDLDRGLSDAVAWWRSEIDRERIA